MEKLNSFLNFREMKRTMFGPGAGNGAGSSGPVGRDEWISVLRKPVRLYNEIGAELPEIYFTFPTPLENLFQIGFKLED